LKPMHTPGVAITHLQEASLTLYKTYTLNRDYDKAIEKGHNMPKSLATNPKIDKTLIPAHVAERASSNAQAHIEQVGSEIRHSPHGQKLALTAKVLKGAGIAGTAYGIYQGVGEVREAMNMAKSNKDQWVKGGEQSADVGTRGLVTGVAATVSAVPGVAAGALTSPVTGPVGPIVGGFATGAAGAAAADKVYEKSWLQEGVRKAGGALGDLSYNYLSKEGRLLNNVNDIKAGLQNAKTETERQALHHKLAPVQAAYNKEAQHNQQYYDGKQAVLNAWDANKQSFPKLDKDTVLDAYDKRFEKGQSSSQGAAGAYEDGLNRAYPHGLPLPAQSKAVEYPNEHKTSALGDIYPLKNADDYQRMLSQPLPTNASSKVMAAYGFAALMSQDDNVMHKGIDQAMNTQGYRDIMQQSESVVMALEKQQALQLAQNQVREISSPSISMRM
jgi:hypothetical protein